ncbi:MAG: hypothetical protein AAB263_11125 [Planctomycetota bacterium]
MADHASSDQQSFFPWLAFKVLLFIALLVILAALIIPFPGDLERMVGNESAAASTLKSSVFAAEIMFQSECRIDQDRNQVGEYGFLRDLINVPTTSTGPYSIDPFRQLNRLFAEGDTAYGYHFAIFLPDGRGGAMTEATSAGPRATMIDGIKVKNAREQEIHFIAYAWPVDARNGRKIFAICESGQVYHQPWDGKTPLWHAAFDLQQWGNLVWSAYR